MFGNLGEMANLLKKVKDIQKNMAELKAEMARSEYSAVSADNKVTAVVSGDFMVKSILIAPDAESSTLNSTVSATVNEALAAAKAAMQEKMKELSGGMNLPGLF